MRPPDTLQQVAQWTRRRPALACRLAALAVFYMVEIGNYHYGVKGVDLAFHLKMTALAIGWAAVSIVCEWLMERPQFTLSARFVWGALDSLMLLAALLFVADGAASALVVGYPLLIAASAFWYRVRFVSVMTGMSLVSYGVLVWDFYCRRTWLQDHFDTSYSRHIFFAVSLIVLGAIVSSLVNRLRMLSKFYGRQLP